MVGPRGVQILSASHNELGTRCLYIEGDIPLLFTENETNNVRIFGTYNAGPYVKDAINEYLINGRAEAVNPESVDTKASSYHRVSIDPGKSAILRVRLSPADPQTMPEPFQGFDQIVDTRLSEANEFYASVIPST